MNKNNKRPWNKKIDRLGIKVCSEAIGWSLIKFAQDVDDQGDLDIQPVSLPAGTQLSNAEYATLREDCGLSLSEIAEFHNTKERTIRYWLKSGPPEAAANEILQLRLQIQSSATKALKTYFDAVEEHGSEPECVDLYRYPKHMYKESQQFEEGLPHGAHNRLVSITADLFSEHGIPISIQYVGQEPSGKQGLDPDLDDSHIYPEDPEEFDSRYEEPGGMSESSH